MVASIFELRQGLEMPSTVVELFKVAIDAMLARAGESSSAADRALLQAVFFRAHCRKSRAITLKDLQAAAQELPNGGAALKSLLDRVKQDRMPLLSLLQLSPLKVQAAHLSFQEYFAARSVCEGKALPTPPWQLEVWYLNMVRLGREMGDDFGRGLLKAPGASSITQEQTRLQLTFKGDAPTAASALGAVLAVATSLGELKIGNVGNKGGLELRADTAKELDLRKRKLGVAGMCIVGFAPARLVDAEEVRLEGNKFGAVEMKALAEAVGMGAFPKAKLKFDGEALDVRKLHGIEPVKELNLTGKGLGPASARAIGWTIAVNAALTALSLGGNRIGNQGATAIADALKFNGALN
eukprot:3679234-Prymnesium_polylepis.1